MIYAHDKTIARDQGLPNTIWPRMSDKGIDFDDVKHYLQERGLSWDLAEENGWYPSREAMDSFLRIVIPAVSTLKGHVYWQARSVSLNVNIRYQTPKGPRQGALIKVDTWQIDALEAADKVVIVEGPTDALAVADCGYDAIALMGITPGELALDHLVKLVDKRPALIGLDNEPEAQVAAHIIAMRLASAGGKVHIAKLRWVKDLAAMAFPARKVWLDKHLEEL